MKRFLLAAALLAAALPFAFGAVRALTTRSDFRYLWVALASALGAAAVHWAGRRLAAKQAIAVAAAAVLVATLLAVAAAHRLGVTLGPGALIVGFCFSLCFGAASALWAFAAR